MLGAVRFSDGEERRGEEGRQERRRRGVEKLLGRSCWGEAMAAAAVTKLEPQKLTGPAYFGRA